MTRQYASLVCLPFCLAHVHQLWLLSHCFMRVYALIAKHVHTPFLKLAWHGLLSCLPSLLILPFTRLSHTQKSVQISAEIEWVTDVVCNCNVLHNLQSI